MFIELFSLPFFEFSLCFLFFFGGGIFFHFFFIVLFTLEYLLAALNNLFQQTLSYTIRFCWLWSRRNHLLRVLCRNSLILLSSLLNINIREATTTISNCSKVIIVIDVKRAELVCILSNLFQGKYEIKCKCQNPYVNMRMTSLCFLFSFSLLFFFFLLQKVVGIFSLIRNSDMKASEREKK